MKRVNMKTDYSINQFWFLLFVFTLICVELAPSFAGNARKVETQQFFETMQDIPLMPGLYEMPEEAVIFDKPEGRIIESSAASETLKNEEIGAFYDQTLPQMGWQRIAPFSYVRQGESLKMRLEEQQGYSVVRFMVAPRP